MVSTPYAPDGLFENIEKEPEETCIYKRIFMDLVKEETSYNDIFDAFRLALRYYKINQSEGKEEQLLIQ